MGRPSVRAEDAAQERESLRRPWPSLPQLIDPQPPSHVAQHQHRDHDVIEGTENRDELRDEVDRVDQPGEQANERKPGSQRNALVREESANESNEVGDDPKQLTK